jgi:hypothetical protein
MSEPVEITVHHYDGNFITIGGASGKTSLTTILEIAGEQFKEPLVDKIKDGEYELLIPTKKTLGQLGTIVAKLSDSYQIYIRKATDDERRTLTIVGSSLPPG